MSAVARKAVKVTDAEIERLDAVIYEMSGVNVNSHPVQAHVLERWTEELRQARDSIVKRLARRKVSRS